MKKLFAVVLMLVLLAGSAGAQAKKKRVTDKKFWFAAATMVATSMLDIESTQRAFNRCPECRELNSWLFGKRPTRRRMYLTLMPITAAEVVGMYFVKKDDLKNNTKAWIVVPIAHNAGHGGAAIYNYVTTKPKQVCPAQGAGCVQ